jgi:hypothetical protein
MLDFVVRAVWCNHADAALGDELYLAAEGRVFLQGLPERGFGGVVAVNIGMIEGGNTQVDTPPDHVEVLAGGEFCTPFTPFHAAGDDW